MMKKLLCILPIVLLTGCFGSRESLQTYQQTSRIDPNVVDRYRVTDSRLEEYVNRIGKKIIIVSSRPNANYHFVVTSEDQAVLAINPEDQTITISKALLQQLKDEAQLATTLALAINKLNHSANIDRDSANDVARAGYDPQALIELQHQYFAASNNNQQFWMSNIYLKPITPGMITANQTMLKKMPQGLMRGSETYAKQLNG